MITTHTDGEEATAGGQYRDPDPAPDGQILLAINANGDGSLWPRQHPALANHACAVAGRNLTREEWSRFITGYRYSQVCP